MKTTSLLKPWNGSVWKLFTYAFRNRNSLFLILPKIYMTNCLIWGQQSENPRWFQRFYSIRLFPFCKANAIVNPNVPCESANNAQDLPLSGLGVGFWFFCLFVWGFFNISIWLFHISCWSWEDVSAAAILQYRVTEKSVAERVSSTEPQGRQRCASRHVKQSQRGNYSPCWKQRLAEIISVESCLPPRNFF